MRAEQNVRLLISSDGGVTLPKEIVELGSSTRAGHDQALQITGGQDFMPEVDRRYRRTLAGFYLDPAGEWRLQGEWQVDSGEPLRLTASG